MNFSKNIDEFNKERKKTELEQKNDPRSSISQEIDEILGNLLEVRSRKDENIAVIDNLISNILERLSTIEYIPVSMIEKNDLCDHLIHFLHPPFSNHISYMIHNIFTQIYTSSRDCAAIVLNTSYFNIIIDYFFLQVIKAKDPNNQDPNIEKENAEIEELFYQIIHSLRFGIQYFQNIADLFLNHPYKERLIYLIYNCNFSEKVIHELICLTDSMLFAQLDENMITFICPILLDFFMNPMFTKICCDTFIRIAKSTRTASLFNYLSNIFIRNDETKGETVGLISSILKILYSHDQTYDIKAKVKSFVLLRHILYYLQSQSNDANPSLLTVHIVTVEFINNIIELFDITINTKPKHLEMAIYSLFQISLNDPSIPSVICKSQVFQVLFDLVNNPDVTYMVGILCRLLFASLLRSENLEVQIYIYENCFNLLVDLFESDEQEFLIEAIDAVMDFLEKMSEAGKNDIISSIVNNDDFSWLRDSLNECMASPIERIARTASYILSQYFGENEPEAENEV